MINGHDYRNRGIDETVAIAIRFGVVTNRILVTGLQISASGAEQRISRALAAGRIERVARGAYVAAADQYWQLSIAPGARLSPTNQLKQVKIPIDSIVAAMQRARALDNRPDLVAASGRRFVGPNALGYR